MPKAKKTTRSKKPSVKVQDMAPKKNAKGGLNFAQPAQVKMGDGSVIPNPELNFGRFK